MVEQTRSPLDLDIKLKGKQDRRPYLFIYISALYMLKSRCFFSQEDSINFSVFLCVLKFLICFLSSVRNVEQYLEGKLFKLELFGYFLFSSQLKLFQACFTRVSLGLAWSELQYGKVAVLFPWHAADRAASLGE